MIDKDTLRQLRDNFHHLQRLKAQEAETKATMIRWCVTVLRRDDNHGVRVYHSHKEAMDVQRENKADKVRALVYLDYLATREERFAQSIEGE